MGGAEKSRRCSRSVLGGGLDLDNGGENLQALDCELS
jgi:hypothetical protein